MKDFLLMRQWGWQSSGVMLGLTFVLAIALVKPIGVSTQYVILDSVLWHAIQPELIQANKDSKSGYSSTNTYLNKNDGKYAKAVAKPLNYGLVFAISMVFGGFFGQRLHQQKKWSRDKKTSTNQIDSQKPKRYALAFLGGFLSLLGAHLAGGCTSGHMMSGMMQTALSGYMFTLSAFIAGIPIAFLLYRNSSSKG